MITDTIPSERPAICWLIAIFICDFAFGNGENMRIKRSRTLPIRRHTHKHLPLPLTLPPSSQAHKGPPLPPPSSPPLQTDPSITRKDRQYVSPLADAGSRLSFPENKLGSLTPSNDGIILRGRILYNAASSLTRIDNKKNLIHIHSAIYEYVHVVHQRQCEPVVIHKTS